MKYYLVSLLAFTGTFLAYSYLYDQDKTLKIGSFELKKLDIFKSREKLNDHLLVNRLNFTKLSDKLSFSSFSTSKRNQIIAKAQAGEDISKLIKRKEGDTTTRILLIGDSEVGGLCYALNDYCRANNHELAYTFVWDASTIYNWAYADTVMKVIDRVEPTFIFFVCGLNELSAMDLERKTKAGKAFAERLKGIPYAWIGPANFEKDKGINKVFENCAESGTFFLSKDLVIPRGHDGRHPSKEGYTIWMNSIATWLSTEAKYRINLTSIPEKKHYRFSCPVLNLNAAKFKGYV